MTFVSSADATGQVVSRRDFLPFGEEITPNVGARNSNPALKYSTTDDPIRQKFTGYQKDNETSLDFAEARMYENRFGRFTAVDPLIASGRSGNPQTFNRFTYVGNSPLKRLDPDGRVWCEHDVGGKFQPVWFSKYEDFEAAWQTDKSYRVTSDFLYHPSAGTWISLDRFSREWEPLSDAQVTSGFNPGLCLTCLRMAGFTKYSGIYGMGTAPILNLEASIFQAFAEVMGSEAVQTFLSEPAIMALPGISAESSMIRGFRAGLAEDTVTAFRVEGQVNQMIKIAEGGETEILNRDRMLFIGFDRARAAEFAAKRIAQYGESNVQIKSFQVRTQYLRELVHSAVPEGMAKLYPENPILVDIKAPLQFGLRPQNFSSLRRNIIQGTGSNSGQ